MANFTINPNKARDIGKEEAASLERDLAALHHFDDDARDPGLPDPATAPDTAFDRRTRQPPVVSEPLREPHLLTPSAHSGKACPPPLQAIAPEIGRHELPRATETGPGQQAAAGYRLVDDLFAMLPPAGAHWTCEERLDWLRAAESAFHLAYHTSGRIRIEADDAGGC